MSAAMYADINPLLEAVLAELLLAEGYSLKQMQQFARDARERGDTDTEDFWSFRIRRMTAGKKVPGAEKAAKAASAEADKEAATQKKPEGALGKAIHAFKSALGQTPEGKKAAAADAENAKDVAKDKGKRAKKYEKEFLGVLQRKRNEKEGRKKSSVGTDKRMADIHAKLTAAVEKQAAEQKKKEAKAGSIKVKLDRVTRPAFA